MELGSKMEVYICKSKWYEGDITRIFVDSEGEWLEVQYACGKVMHLKQFPCDDEDAIYRSGFGNGYRDGYGNGYSINTHKRLRGGYVSGYVGGHVYEENSGAGYGYGDGYRDEFLKGGFLLHQSINIPKELV